MPRYLHSVDTLAEDDEPVFTLSAADPLAARLVAQWAREAAALGADPDHCECVRRWADQMAKWHRKHGALILHAPHAPMDPGYQQACRADREGR